MDFYPCNAPNKMYVSSCKGGCPLSYVYFSIYRLRLQSLKHSESKNGPPFTPPEMLFAKQINELTEAPSPSHPPIKAGKKAINFLDSGGIADTMETIR